MKKTSGLLKIVLIIMTLACITLYCKYNQARKIISEQNKIINYYKVNYINRGG